MQHIWLKKYPGYAKFVKYVEYGKYVPYAAYVKYDTVLNMQNIKPPLAY